MLDTTALFHDNPYQKETECWLDAVERDSKGNPFVLLSDTVFYPQGGGQMGDRGELIIESGQTFSITNTKKDDQRRILHFVDVVDDNYEELNKSVGQKIVLKLNWEARYHQMRIHSAVHLIHCMLEEDLGKEIPYPRRAPLSDVGGENQYEFVGEFSEQDLETANFALNKFLAEDHIIATHADDAKGEGFRWWKCGKWSIPCGGVHVKSTSEIGATSCSMKVKKGTTRVSVTLGN